MPSFDIVSETDMQEVDNVLQNVMREVDQRYDFKGSKCSIERNQQEVTVLADDEYKRDQIEQLLKGHCTRRNVEPKALDFGAPEAAGGGGLRQKIIVRQGIDQETAKKIVKEIKAAKLKVQASIQGDSVRVSGKKRDDLQEAIALVKALPLELPLQYINFRD